MSAGRKGKIRIEAVTKIFGSEETGTAVTALDNVSLGISPGEFISIVGTSGCGKSTLLRMISGLEHPTKGFITVDEEEIREPNHHRGLVFQDPTLFPWLTVEQNISFGPRVRNVYKEKKEEVAKFIKMIGLEGFENHFSHQLSGGMAQRVALARALVNEPTVMMLDEPLGALDAFTRMQMQDEILNIWEQNKATMVLVTHDVDEAIYMSDRIVIMSARPGKIKKIIEVPLGRPRARNHPDFFAIRSKILELLNFAREDDLQYYL